VNKSIIKEFDSAGPVTVGVVVPVSVFVFVSVESLFPNKLYNNILEVVVISIPPISIPQLNKLKSNIELYIINYFKLKIKVVYK